LDLLVGERSGTVNYFENTGAPEKAVFTVNPTVEEFGNVDVMPECCTGYSTPFMTTDSLGNSILYVGSEQGKLYLFNNIDNNLSGSFDAVDSLYMYAINLSISGADIDNDGQTEFVSGEFAGGISFLETGDPPSLGIADEVAISDPFRVYPNPAKDFIYIKAEQDFQNKNCKIIISDLKGKKALVTENTFQAGAGYVHISTLKPGIYILQILMGDYTFSEKIVVE
jgi:hypothetical protein